MADYSRIPQHQTQHYDNGASPFAGAQPPDQRRSHSPVSALTDRLIRGFMGQIENHSHRTLDKLEYAHSLQARQQNGEDISWRSPRFASPQQNQYMGGNHGGPHQHHMYGQPPPPPPRRGQQEFVPEQEGDQHFSPPLPPRRDMRTQQADLHPREEDLRSEYGSDMPALDEHQARQQALAQHLEGLPEMIHGMLSEFMEGMQLQVAELAQRVQQLERGQGMQAPPAPTPRQASPILHEESPQLPPRPGADHPTRQSGIKRRPVPGRPPALPQRTVMQHSMDIAESLTAPASHEEDRAEREPLSPVPRREFPPPPLHPEAAQRKREREAHMRRMSISTDTTTETQHTRTDAEQYVDNDDSRTHDQNYRTRPLLDESAPSGSTAPGLAAGVGEGGSNQTDADAAKTQLANLKAYANLNHEALDFAERLTR